MEFNPGIQSQVPQTMSWKQALAMLWTMHNTPQNPSAQAGGFSQDPFMDPIGLGGEQQPLSMGLGGAQGWSQF